MPPSRETILAALHARLLALPATALRGEVLPERVPTAGLLILRYGEPGEPEVTRSPLAYHYQHRAEIEAVVQGAYRDAAFDTLTASIGAALAADGMMGGLCDWVEAEAPRPVDLPVEGASLPYRMTRTGTRQDRIISVVVEPMMSARTRLWPYAPMTRSS